MKRTLTFIYRFKFTQPEGAPLTTEETPFSYQLMNFTLESLIKNLGATEKAIQENILPNFIEIKNNVFSYSDITDKVVTEIFYFFIERLKKAGKINGIEQIEIIEILLLP